MMTTGSVRGKCWAPQAGQARRQPASAGSDGRAAVGAEAVRLVPAEDALGGGGGAGLGGVERGHLGAQVAEAEAVEAGVAARPAARRSPRPAAGRRRQSGTSRA